MRRSGRTGPRLVAIFLLGAVLLNYPVLSLFARPGSVWGIPTLDAYVFGVWMLLIALMALVVERVRD
jgi:hypothetical protein